MFTIIGTVIAVIITFVKNYKTYLVIGLVGLLMTTGAYFVGHTKGVNDQKLIQANADASAIKKGVQAHAQKQREVNQLTDPDLDSRISKWMRD